MTPVAPPVFCVVPFITLEAQALSNSPTDSEIARSDVEVRWKSIVCISPSDHRQVRAGRLSDDRWLFSPFVRTSVASGLR